MTFLWLNCIFITQPCNHGAFIFCRFSVFFLEEKKKKIMHVVNGTRLQKWQNINYWLNYIPHMNLFMCKLSTRAKSMEYMLLNMHKDQYWAETKKHICTWLWVYMISFPCFIASLPCVSDVLLICSQSTHRHNTHSALWCIGIMKLTVKRPTCEIPMFNIQFRFAFPHYGIFTLRKQNAMSFHVE